MKTSKVAAELETRIAVALAMTAGSIGPFGDTVKRLNNIHEALKSQRASGLLTDAEYTKERASEYPRQLRRPDFGSCITASVNATAATNVTDSTVVVVRPK